MPSPSTNAVNTSAPTSISASSSEQVEQVKPVEQKSISSPPDANITPLAGEIIHTEEKTEYRDQFGNLLDEEQVRSLDQMSDQVLFKTLYETRTRLVDVHGNFLGWEDEGSVAPHHPDVEGGNPETGGPGAVTGKDQPATVDAQKDTEKERSVEEEQKHGAKAKPASEGNPEATK